MVYADYEPDDDESGTAHRPIERDVGVRMSAEEEHRRLAWADPAEAAAQFAALRAQVAALTKERDEWAAAAIYEAEQKNARLMEALANNTRASEAEARVASLEAALRRYSESRNRETVQRVRAENAEARVAALTAEVDEWKAAFFHHDPESGIKANAAAWCVSWKTEKAKVAALEAGLRDLIEAMPCWLDDDGVHHDFAVTARARALLSPVSGPEDERQQRSPFDRFWRDIRTAAGLPQTIDELLSPEEHAELNAGLARIAATRRRADLWFAA